MLLADQFRSTELGKKKRVLPTSLEKGGGTEPLTPLGSGDSKRIDVTIADAVLGLEVGVSLKGLNFKDEENLNYDKNVTGRLYELADEVRMVHEHLPHCFMAGIFFMPLESTSDKKGTDATSSFANVVLKLRDRTGRIDPAISGQAARCDVSYVGLYSLGDDGAQRGAVRFFDTSKDPPQRGRPRMADTISVKGIVDDIIANATYTKNIRWGEAEEDEPPEATRFLPNSES